VSVRKMFQLLGSSACRTPGLCPQTPLQKFRFPDFLTWRTIFRNAPQSLIYNCFVALRQLSNDIGPQA